MAKTYPKKRLPHYSNGGLVGDQLTSAKKRLAKQMSEDADSRENMTMRERDWDDASKEAFRSGDYTAKGEYSPWSKRRD